MGRHGDGGSDLQGCPSQGWRHHCQRTRTHQHCPERQFPGLPLFHEHKGKQESQRFKACLDYMVSSTISKSYTYTDNLSPKKKKTKKTERAHQRGSAMKGVTPINLPARVWPWDMEGENSPSCPLTSTDLYKSVCEERGAFNRRT